MKFKNKIFIISLILIILLGISSVNASEEDVVLANDTMEVLTSNDDVEVQTEENNDEQLGNDEWDKLSTTGSFADLHAAIESHYGSTLVLENSYENNGNEDVITLNGDITIDGNGHTIDANGNSGIFSIDGYEYNLVLKNIIFKNAYGGWGGAVSINSKVANFCEIDNCTFIQNQAKNGGGAIFFSTKGSLEIKNSIFKSNYAIYSSSEMNNGGAVLVKGGELLVENSLFEDNDSRGYGGAIYSDVKTDIIGCTFNRNYAVKRAGSVYMNDGDSFLTDSTFTSSSCEGDGGAVYSLMYLGVENCSFTDCYASNNGGAIYCAFAIEFYENPSVFINNRVSVDNKVYANKGGAIYTGTFESDVNGIVFINNRAWYGGAIYINNKNTVSFDSCYFKENVAKNAEGTSGCGAAIYLDSSSSHLSLTDNIFLDNEAVDDMAVYNCGKYNTVKNNWWGVNSPNFYEPYLIEWHRIGSNDKHSDSNPLKISLVSDKELDSIQTSATLTLKFTDNDGVEFTGKLPQWDVSFRSNNNVTFESKSIVGNKATVICTAQQVGFTAITAKVNNQEVILRMMINGDFQFLQQLVDNSDGVLNLTRNYTYSIGEDTIIEGIKITKPFKINGNGYTIDALGQSRIFFVTSSGVEINNLNFINGNSMDDDGCGGAIRLNWTGNILISNCNFTSNIAKRDGGAIMCSNYLETEISIVNCSFTNNSALQGGAIDGDQYTKFVNCSFIGNKASSAGAVYFRGRSTEIFGCKFINNAAESWGGAIYSSYPGNSISDSIFRGNVAKIGGAIYAFRSLSVINSSFIENKASSIEILNSVEDNILTLSLKGNENYINAIYADNRYDPDQNIVLLNVTYWNGEIVTGDNMNKSDNASGQNIILEIYDSNNRLVKNTVLKTGVDGLAKYDCSELEGGNYTFKAYHLDDEYYTRSSDATGSFKVTHLAPNPSSVTITTPDGKEFSQDYVHIDFTYENETEIRVLITNFNGSEIFYDYLAGFNYVEPILPASDEYYNITIFNIGNKTFQPSKDSIIFKVNKINSTIEIDLSSLYQDILYNSTRIIDFVGDNDCHDYNVTIYDENNACVYSTIVFVPQTYGHVELPLLNVGNYNITVINLGNVNKKPKNQTASFKIVKADNNLNVTVDDNVYGKEITVTVRANVDGEYLVKINSTSVTVNVVDGMGSEIVELGAGYYTANVTFANENYANNAINDTFTIQKAQSHVGIEDFGDVVLNQNRTIRFTDFYMTTFNVTIYTQGNVVVSSENTTSLLYKIPNLQIDTYNITVTNLGNENIIGSQASYTFNVVSTNNVQVFVDDEDYGRDLLIVVTADVDGLYTVNINGTEVVVEVEDGIGFDDTLQLPAGNYSANVTFDNPYYTNNITNTTFTIFKAQSNLQIYEIGNVTYGADVLVWFYDDYPTTFLIEVVDHGAPVMNATFEYDDKNPEMMVILSGLDVGEYAVIVYNNGDENVDGSVNAMPFNVTELPGTIIASDMTRGYNSGMDFNVTLVDKNGTGIAKTIVTFVINGKEYNAITDANGVAVINAKLAVGTYVVDVINPYNDVLTTKNLKIVTRITGNKNVNTYYGKNYQYKLRIIGDNGSPVGAGVVVKVTINGKVKNLKTDKNGYITVKFTKNYLPKTYKVTAEYKGIKVSNKVVVKKVLKLKKAKVKRSAKKLKLKATLKEGKKALKGKKVVFKFKGKKYTAKTNKKGVAKVTIKKKILKKLKKGKKVKYQVTYLKHTVKRTAKVKR